MPFSTNMFHATNHFYTPFIILNFITFRLKQLIYEKKKKIKKLQINTTKYYFIRLYSSELSSE